MTTFAPQKQPSSNDAWHQIDALIERAVTLAKADVSPAAFYSSILTELSEIVSASESMVWNRGNQGWQLAHREVTQEIGETRLPEPVDEWLDSVHQSMKNTAFSWPQRGLSKAPTSLICAIVAGQQTVAVAELRCTEERTSTTRDNQLELLAAVCEIAGDYEERRLLRESEAQEMSLMGPVLEVFHSTLGMEPICFAIANESSRLLGADRASVLVERGNRLRLQAVSGLDQFDPRSEEVHRLEELVTAVTSTGEPLWSCDGAGEVAEQLQQPLSNYLDQSTTRTVIVIPIAEPDTQERDNDHDCPQHRVLGALVIERFEARPLDRTDRRRLATIAKHSFLALRNSLCYAQIPWPARVAGTITNSLWKKRWFVSCCIAFAMALVLALILIPTDFEIDCPGELRPAVLREVFAPADGTVDELLISSGDHVSAGDRLLVLRNSELAFQRTKLEGELNTNRGHLNTIEAAISTIRGQGAEAQQTRLQLTAELKRAAESAKNLEQQLELVRFRIARLTVESPLTGRVLTSALNERLASRPVQRGQRLLTVADVEGPWQLKLRVADHDIGQLLASAKGGATLPVSFLLTSKPKRRYAAQLCDIGLATETGEDGSLHVPVVAALDRAELHRPRFGAGVVARIHCGRRSIAYVWLRDVIDVVRSRLLF